MIYRQIVGFNGLVKDIGFWNTLCGLVHDDVTLIDVLKGLDGPELHQVYKDDKCIGFFTKQYLGSCVEIHAYINPEYRKYSIAALREMERACKEPIKTSVWGTHSHVSSILKKMGFKHTHTEKDAIRKGGKAYDMEYFYKEKVDG